MKFHIRNFGPLRVWDWHRQTDFRVNFIKSNLIVPKIPKNPIATVKASESKL